MADWMRATRRRWSRLMLPMQCPNPTCGYKTMSLGSRLSPSTRQVRCPRCGVSNPASKWRLTAHKSSSVLARALKPDAWLLHLVTQLN